MIFFNSSLEVTNKFPIIIIMANIIKKIATEMLILDGCPNLI